MIDRTHIASYEFCDESCELPPEPGGHESLVQARSPGLSKFSLGKAVILRSYATIAYIIAADTMISHLSRQLAYILCHIPPCFGISVSQALFRCRAELEGSNKEQRKIITPGRSPQAPFAKTSASIVSCSESQVDKKSKNTLLQR